MKVRFNDLQSQYLQCKEGIDNAIQGVLNKSDYILGEAVSDFEREFADYCGTKYAVAVDNGTTALELALRTLGIGEGDEVITVANTFIATTLAISAVGAKIVLVDCDGDMLMDMYDLQALITDKTKAIIPVHLFGQMCNMQMLMDIARKHDLKVIEDCSQAHGAFCKMGAVGTIGDIGCFSLYPAKGLGACGDAGIIVTENKEYHDHLIKLRNYGSEKKYYHDFEGRNARMDTMQAAILSVKLPHLNKWNEKRNEIANWYMELLSDVTETIELPSTKRDNYHVWHLFVIGCERRDELQAHLKEHGIETGIHYPVPLHKQKCYEGYDFGSKNIFGVSELLSKEILSLPMHPYLTQEEVEYVCEKIKQFYK